MSMSVLFVILFIVVALIVIFWATRTRGNTTGPHVDTTMTAVGAVTEAVEELADTVKHAVGHEPAKAEAAPAPKPAEAVALKASAPVATKAPEPAKAPAATPAKAAASKAAKAAAPKPASASKAATAPKPAASKATTAKPAKTPTAAPAKSAAPDELRQLKGVGPKLVTLLNELGVTRFDQIAGWKTADIETIDAQLGTFKGRIVRDNWVEQAGFLAKGDIEGFEAKFGKLDSPGNS